MARQMHFYYPIYLANDVAAHFQFALWLWKGSLTVKYHRLFNVFFF